MLLYFNPGHETAVLNASPYYVPPDVVLKMQHDLAFLPAWYGTADDLAWVKRNFPISYFNEIQAFFPDIPKPVCEDNLSLYAPQELACWGITPQAFHYFTTLKEQYNLNLTIPKWREDFFMLTSRRPARECLEDIFCAIPDISRQLLPQFCRTVKDVENIVLKTDNLLLIKAPFSSSGRGLLWLRNGLDSKEREVIHGMLKKQSWVTIEPVVQKTLDFSMQFVSDGKGNISFKGYSIFNTNEKGAYQESILQQQSKTENDITSFISIVLLEQVKKEIIRFMQKRYATLYKGAISVDMMIYRDEEEYKLHPCVEINMRYSMGFLALQLFENYIFQDSFGVFKISYYRDAKALNLAHDQLTRLHPLQIENGKIRSGYFALCPVMSESCYLPYINLCSEQNPP